MYYVYVIRNEKNELYIGYTNDLEKRLQQHNSIHRGYTNGHEWKYVYYEAYLNQEDARLRERRLKEHGQTKRRLRERIQRSISQE